MRLTKMYAPTLKETPADAEVVSHQLMLRAGMIRKLAAGVYTYLPLGLRVLRKVEAIVREEMNRAGAQEVFMPAVQPAELWQESGRWAHYGPELLRVRDRHNREFCIGPTHEEVITDLVRRDVRSYRELPLNLYQIQTKFRDEVRPRFGLMRGREFSMKDAYSFDANDAGADASYEAMRQAYHRIFARCGLEFREVAADSGNIGGAFSAEFMVLAETGEDLIVYSDTVGYAANVEKAELVETPDVPFAGAMTEVAYVHTPHQRTIDEVSAFLNVAPSDLIKTLIYLADGEPVVALVRGDHELNEIKLKNALRATELELADPETIVKVTGAPVGFAGPHGLGAARTIADFALRGGGNFVSGANREDYHVTGLNLGRDFTPGAWADIRVAREGDVCPRGGKYQILRGIEVGHIFKLGTKYSQAMRCTFLDENGQEQPAIMGCYGIGVGRTAAASIEQNHDEKGIIWPMPLAPYQVVVVPIGKENGEEWQTAERVYNECLALGVEAVFDDRDERPGVKFNDAELIGYPLRVNVGKKSLAEGKVEVQNRTGDWMEKVPAAEIAARIKQIVQEALHAQSA